jgi:hypothetical protein
MISTIDAYVFDGASVELMITGPAEPPVVSVAGEMTVLGCGRYHEVKLGNQPLISWVVYSDAPSPRTAKDNVWIGSLPDPNDVTEAKIQIAADGEVRTGTLRWQKPAPAPAPPVVPMHRKRSQK